MAISIVSPLPEGLLLKFEGDLHDEGCDLCCYFQKHNYIILHNINLPRFRISEIDETLKRLSQKDFEKRTEYEQDKFPTSIKVWRGKKAVYLIDD